MTDAPSAWQIERALALWHDAQQKLDAIGEDRAEKAPPLDDLLGMIDALIIASIHANDDAKTAAARAKIMQEDAARYLRRKEVHRQLAFGLMELLPIRQRRIPGYGTPYIDPGRPSYIVTDMNALPDEYKETRTKTEVVERGDKLLADLKDGLVIEGAVLRNPQPHLVVRTK